MIKLYGKKLSIIFLVSLLLILCIFYIYFINNKPTTVTMKVNSKKNTELVIPSKESIKNNGYPINEDGQTYGPDMGNIISDSPDLILAEGKNGVIGYKSYNSKITSPDDLKRDALAKEDESIPLYL